MVPQTHGHDKALDPNQAHGDPSTVQNVLTTLRAIRAQVNAWEPATLTLWVDGRAQACSGSVRFLGSLCQFEADRGWDPYGTGEPAIDFLFAPGQSFWIDWEPGPEETVACARCLSCGTDIPESWDGLQVVCDDCAEPEG